MLTELIKIMNLIALLLFGNILFVAPAVSHVTSSSYTTVNPADVKPTPGTGRPVVVKSDTAEDCEEGETLFCVGDYCECQREYTAAK